MTTFMEFSFRQVNKPLVCGTFYTISEKLLGYLYQVDTKKLEIKLCQLQLVEFYLELLSLCCDFVCLIFPCSRFYRDELKKALAFKKNNATTFF